MSEKNFLRTLRTLYEIEVDHAPSQHPLETPLCLPLVRFAPSAQEKWTDEERAHVTGCPYCERMMALIWREKCPSLWKLAQHAGGIFPCNLAMQFHLVRDGCPRCNQVLESRPMIRLRELVEQLRNSAASAVVVYQEPGFAGEFASTKRAPLIIRGTNDEGSLVSTLLESDEGFLVLYVESPDTASAGRRIAAEVINEGEPLVAELELGPAGEFGCRAEHVFGPIREFERVFRGCMLLVHWTKEVKPS